MASRGVSTEQIKQYVIAGALALAIVWLVFLCFSIGRKEEIARHAAKDTSAQLIALQAREATLQGNLDELNTPRGKEATLRQTYGVARPGEQVIIVVPPSQPTSTPVVPWWQKAINWFKI